MTVLTFMALTLSGPPFRSTRVRPGVTVVQIVVVAPWETFIAPVLTFQTHLRIMIDRGRVTVVIHLTWQ